MPEKRAETAEYSIEVDPRFENVRIFGTSIGQLRAPETTFSPRLSIWTIDAMQDVTPTDFLSGSLEDESPLVERRTIGHAGMKGEFYKVKDHLEDQGTGEAHDWYRLKALLVSPDGTTWYQASAMSTGEELAEIETAFFRMLDSIEVKRTGTQAVVARANGTTQVDALLEGLRKNLDRAAQQAQEHRAAAEKAEAAAAAVAPIDDVETRFDKALAAMESTGQRDALRAIAVPALSLTEIGEAPEDETGLTRVGGGPDLPEGIEWPRDDRGFHLNFLAQIDLARLPVRYEPLPDSGLLSFFSGGDLQDWRVLYTPAGATLVAHSLPEDAERLAQIAERMVNWDSGKQRLVITADRKDGLTVAVDSQGRARFERNGEPVIALASEYEISRSQQLLRAELSLTVPCDLTAEDTLAFQVAVQTAFSIGDGPQHQMFGAAGIRSVKEQQEMAAEHARKQGWTELANGQDWFVLLKLASGGEANFCFWDYGDFIFLANRKDTARGDFSRTYAFVESS